MPIETNEIDDDKSDKIQDVKKSNKWKHHKH